MCTNCELWPFDIFYVQLIVQEYFVPKGYLYKNNKKNLNARVSKFPNLVGVPFINHLRTQKHKLGRFTVGQHIYK